MVVEGGEGEGVGSGEEGDLDFEGLGVEPGEGERAAGAGDDYFFGVDPGGAGEGDSEDVKGWLEAAFAEVCAEEPADPMKAMAAKCGTYIRNPSAGS